MSPPPPPDPARGTRKRRPAPSAIVGLASAAALSAATLLAAAGAGAPLRPELATVAWIAAGALLGLAGAYRPLRRGQAGLAAAPIPALALTLSATGAAWAAVLARLLRPTLLRRLSPSARPQERRRLSRRLSDSLAVGAVTLAAASLLRSIWGFEPATRLFGAVASLALYALGLWAVERLQRLDRKPPRSELAIAVRERELDSSLWDGVGWALGLAAAPAVLAVGWPRTAPLFVALALLAIMAAFERGRAEALRDQLQALERVATIVATPSRRRSDLTLEIVRSVSQILEYGWIEVGLLDGSDQLEIHSAERGGRLRSGPATPSAWPARRRGIHRRRGWVQIHRPLTTADRHLGYVKLWCDPRRLDPARAELLEALVQQLSATVERVVLGAEANLDPLTGLVKRAVFEQRLAKSFEHSRRSGVPLAVAMLDIDWFKAINDTWGHAAGDQALVEVSRALRETMRRADLCCRYGGEEFAMVLDGLDGAGALVAVDRLREAVEELDTDLDGERVGLTLSAGVAAIPELVVDDWKSLLELADQALYAAKRSGRNRTLLSAGPDRFRGVEGVAYGPPARPPAAPQL